MDGILKDGVQLKAITARAFGGDAHFFEDSIPPEKVRSQLDSVKDSDKLKGMKQLLAMISKGNDVPEFFPDVVKNVVVRNIEVKKLVYVYLVHYADFSPACREIALLSINSFQKDLSDSNQFFRGLALRVMTSIRVPDIIPIQLVAVRKCAGDSSPYVRKCAANALPKLVAYDIEQLEPVKVILSKLLDDKSTMVLGSAMAAFNEVCPVDYALLHCQYRKICELLVDMDEWTQSTALEVLTRYVRSQFRDPAPGALELSREEARQRSTAILKGQLTTSVRKTVRVRKSAFYSDEESASEEEEIIEVAPRAMTNGAVEWREEDLEADHALVLRSTLPLLKSRNPAVVLSVCSLHYYVGLPDGPHLAQIAKAMVRILRGPRETVYMVLQSILEMSRVRPAMFRAHLRDFFVNTNDALFNKLLKLDILSTLCDAQSVKEVVRECEIYIKDPCVQFSTHAVRTLGRICDFDPQLCPSCVQGIMALLLCSLQREDGLARECVLTLRVLMQHCSLSQSAECVEVLRHLVKLLLTSEPPRLTDPVARSCVVWLVAEYYAQLKKVVADVLRLLAKSFADEEAAVKMQIMNFAVKLSVAYPDHDVIQTLMTYVLEMARYDASIDLRDRARMLTALMGLGTEEMDEDALTQLTAHARNILLSPKLPPVMLLEQEEQWLMGSLSSVVGYAVPGYVALGEWSTTRSSSHIRDPRVESSGLGHDFATKTRARSSSGSGLSSESDEERTRSRRASRGRSGKGRDSRRQAEDDSDSDDSSSSLSSSSSSSSSNSSSSASSSASSASTSSASTSSSSSSSSTRRPVSRASASLSTSSVTRASSQASETRKHGTLPELSASSVSGPRIAAAPAVASSPITSSVPRTQAPIRRMAKKSADPFSPMTRPMTMEASPSLSDLAGDMGGAKVRHTTSSSGGGVGTLLDLPEPFLPSGPPTTSSQMDILGMGDVLQTGLEAGHAGTDARVASILSTFTTNPMTRSLSDGSSGGGGVDSGTGLAAHVSPAKSPQPQQAFLFESTLPLGPSPSPYPPQPPVTAASVTQTPFQTESRMLISPDLSAGLQVTYALRPMPSSPVVYCVLELYNTRDYPFRRVKFTFPPALRLTAVVQDETVAPGQRTTRVLEIAQPREIVNKPMRIEMRTDRCTSSGVLVIAHCDLVTPYPMDVAAFLALRERMRGFNEQAKSYALGVLRLPAVEGEQEAHRRVMRGLYVHAMQHQGEMLFSGAVRKGGAEERVLITLAVDGSSITLRVNCEDPVFCSSFHDEVKQLLSKP